MNTNEKKLTSIRIHRGLYEYLKRKAGEENRSFNNYIETLLFEASDYYEPNEETVEAILEAREDREEMRKFESKEDLKRYFEELTEED